MIRALLLFLLLFFNNFASFAQVNHWETVVYNSDTWRYFIGNSEPPSIWNSPTFNDANWLSGRGGIGYGDGDDQTIIGPAYALYIRTKFDITNLEAIHTAILQADYDDAYVAYLNGVEIGRANITGVPPRFDTETVTDHEATLYQSNSVESVFLEANTLAGLLVEGENVLAISIHNRFGPESSDMTANFFLTLGINDTSNDYGPTPSWFTPPSFDSTLPIVKISTNGGVLNGDSQIEGQIGIVNNPSGENSFFDTPNEYAGNIGVKYRGQSSLWFAKKSLGIEMRDELWNDLDTSFLDFPKEEDWILHGPYSDKSLMRNVLTMHLAREMGQYASKTQYVDLFINGDYQGIYVLMEKIKRDKDRVDVAKLRDIDIDGDELTGGYIFRIDKDEAHWLSRYSVFRDARKLEYQIVYPDLDKIQPAQFAYIQTYVDSFERAMVSPNLVFGGKSFEEYIDLTSFAEAHLLNELGRNVDGYRLSSYFHKQKDSNGGKIFAGPVWDFNLAFRNADYCDGANTEGLIFYNLCDGGYPFWWDVLLKNPQFQSIVRCRWEELRAGPFHKDSIFTFIDQQVDIIEPSLAQNFAKWNVFGTYLWPNPLPLADSHSEEIALLKDWLSDRLTWMDANLAGDCNTTVGLFDITVNDVFIIMPNPAHSQLQIAFTKPIKGPINSIFLINGLGHQFDLPFNGGDLLIDISDFPTGMYFVGIVLEGKTYLQKLVIE